MFKKVLAILMICFIFCGSCFAYSHMTTAGLHNILDQVRIELLKRELSFTDNILVFEDEGVSLYFTGNYQLNVVDEDFTYIYFETILINNSDKEMWLDIPSAYVNGWKVFSGMIEETAPGKIHKSGIDFTISDANVFTVDDIEEIMFTYAFMDAETYEPYYSPGNSVVIHFEESL